VTGALLTNFHLPQSTLLMLASSFFGRWSALRAYEHAVREKYRFFSYGGCMLVEWNVDKRCFLAVKWNTELLD